MIIFDNDRNPNHQIVQDQWYLIELFVHWGCPFKIAKFKGYSWDVDTEHDEGPYSLRLGEVKNYAKIE